MLGEYLALRTLQPAAQDRRTRAEVFGCICILSRVRDSLLYYKARVLDSSLSPSNTDYLSDASHR